MHLYHHSVGVSRIAFVSMFFYLFICSISFACVDSFASTFSFFHINSCSIQFPFVLQKNFYEFWALSVEKERESEKKHFSLISRAEKHLLFFCWSQSHYTPTHTHHICDDDEYIITVMYIRIKTTPRDMFFLCTRVLEQKTSFYYIYMHSTVSLAFETPFANLY